MPDTKPITVDLETTLMDPSGGRGVVRPVPVLPELEEIDGEVLLTFTFLNAPADARFTAFRYYNTNDQFYGTGWWKPYGAEGPGHTGPNTEFQDLTISEDGKSMNVIDQGTGGSLYLYIVEWTTGGGTYVCDPKIKNLPQ